MTEIFDDIKKIYEFRSPCEELAHYVDFFSESSFEATQKYTGGSHFSVKMFPSWTPTFWINLGPAYHLSLGNKDYYIPAGDGVVVTRDTVAERHNHPSDHLFTIKFYPGGLESVLGIDQSRIGDKPVTLANILPLSLIHEIKRTNDFEKRLQLLETFFLLQLKGKKKKEHYLSFVTQTIAVYTSGEMRYNLDELSRRLFTSSKTINRYFSKTIGTSPKNYLSAVRARTALTAFVANKRTFSPPDFGYYDMSHFYKEMIRFTGQRMMCNRD
jgi:AraC-like DNA-binding protein